MDAAGQRPKEDRVGAQAGLHVVYRSYAGENAKPRPPYYGKRLALFSFLRAVAGLARAPELLFLNDGPVDDELTELMSAHGEVQPIQCGSTRRSYRTALAIAGARAWPQQDLVWFAEDDYLYTPESLVALTTAADRLPQADYLSLWGHLALDVRSPRTSPRTAVAAQAPDVPGSVEVDGVRWYRQLSTTSTFGMRAGVLAADLRLLRTIPYTGGAWDDTTCQVVQGLQPFRWQAVGRCALGAVPFQRGPVNRRVIRAGAQAAMNTTALGRRPRRRRTLFASDPQLIHHMEYPDQSVGNRDWSAVAVHTLDWAREQGLADS